MTATTKADVFAAIESARNTALKVLEAVRSKRDWMFLTPALWPQIPGADGYVENAAMSVATIELLPEVLDDALASQDVATALGQAMVIVEQTEESTRRYAEWAEKSALVQLVTDVWYALKEVLADFAYEVADAVLVVGRAAVKGAGWGGLWILGGMAVIGGGLLLAKR